MRVGRRSAEVVISQAKIGRTIEDSTPAWPPEAPFTFTGSLRNVVVHIDDDQVLDGIRIDLAQLACA
jgi:hypothetical protein